MAENLDVAAFPAVDEAFDPRAMIGFLDRARSLPGLRIAKARAVRALRLRSGHSVLDVGCGTGEDALEMARAVMPSGRVIGVDASRLMLAEARRRADDAGLPVDFREGDALALPVPSGSVDACRGDTLLQHLDRPQAAVAEMVRVTRPGGRVVLVEFDHGATVVDHPDEATTDRLLARFRDAAATGRAGRSLHRLAVDAGLAEVTVGAEFVESVYPVMRGLLTPASDWLREHGDVPAETLDAWWATLDELWQRGRFYAGALVFVAAGVVPA